VQVLGNESPISHYLSSPQACCHNGLSSIADSSTPCHVVCNNSNPLRTRVFTVLLVRRLLAMSANVSVTNIAVEVNVLASRH